MFLSIGSSLVEDLNVLLFEQKLINMIRLVACPRIFMVNNYRESHTKVRMANAARTITCHMNFLLSDTLLYM